MLQVANDVMFRRPTFSMRMIVSLLVGDLINLSYFAPSAGVSLSCPLHSSPPRHSSFLKKVATNLYPANGMTDHMSIDEKTTFNRM